jgi:hypothetical protein
MLPDRGWMMIKDQSKTELLKRAEEARRLAAVSRDATARTEFLKLGEMWERLAGAVIGKDLPRTH